MASRLGRHHCGDELTEKPHLYRLRHRHLHNGCQVVRRCIEAGEQDRGDAQRDGKQGCETMAAEGADSASHKGERRCVDLLSYCGRAATTL